MTGLRTLLLGAVAITLVVGGLAILNFIDARLPYVALLVVIALIIAWLVGTLVETLRQ